MLAQLGTNEAKLADPDGSVPVTTYHAAIAIIAERTNDPILGLHYIQEVGFGSLDAIGFLAMSSRTIGESIERYLRHIERLSESCVQAMQVRDGQAFFTLECWGPETVGKHHLVEMYAAGVLIMAAQIIGARSTSARFRFAINHALARLTVIAPY